MGFRFLDIHALHAVLPPFSERADKKVLTLGVLDCYFTYDELTGFLKQHAFAYRDLDASQIDLTTGFKWAADPARHSRNVHQRTLFRCLGFAEANIHALDFSDYEKPELVHDMNLPIPGSLHGAYDLIFDGGTTEHVFSPPMALRNLVAMTRLGGTVVHASPVDFLNHGYYNMSAELFDDFYAANGFDRRYGEYLASEATQPGKKDSYYLAYEPAALHFSLQPRYRTVYFGAYSKVAELDGTVIPQQGYYQSIWHKSEGGNAPSRRRRLASLLDRVPALAAFLRRWRLRRAGRRVDL